MPSHRLFLALTIVCSFNVGCNTLRLRYMATSQDSPKGPQNVHVEKSYPVGGAIVPLCYITAIFYGGACWFYTVMPTVLQKNKIKEDARKLAAKQLSIPPESLKDETVERISWGTGPTLFNGQSVAE